MEKFFLGIDGGTEGVRAGIFTKHGKNIAFSSIPYKTTFPKPSWAEQNPEDWWKSFCQAIENVLKKAQIQPKQIAALAVDTTCCSVVFLDEAFQSIRPALIWMDLRSAEEAQLLSQLDDEHLKVNGNGQTPVSAEWMIPKSLWLKKNEPENYRRARYICEYQDYINYQFTGEYIASRNTIANRWHCSEDLPISLLEKLDFTDLLEKWPQKILNIGDGLQEISKKAARETGLAPGTLIVQGGVDACLGAIGMGMVNNGQIALMTGSSHLQLGLSHQPFHSPGLFGTYKDSMIEGLHLIEGGQTSTGSIIKWFKNMLGENMHFDELNAKASQIEPGAAGLLVLDHFQGNRTPYADPKSRGMLCGLSLAHTPFHIFRAIMEGVVFGTKVIFDTMQQAGMQIDSFVIAGGAAKSPLWLQIHADICNKEVLTTQQDEAACLGSAIAAAYGYGSYESLAAAAQAMVKIKKTIRPNPKNHSLYVEIYQKYKQLYPLYKNLQ